MNERDLINLAEEHDDMFDLFMADQGVITTRAKWKARALKAEATIARLSEALAEAEKKGAEARAKAFEDAIEAIRTAAVTTTLSGDDAASFCNGADWMEGEAIKAIRDLSQGGQHG